MMKLSVVIPTIGRLAALRRCLASLAQQMDPGYQFEVVVVSNPGQQSVERLVDEVRACGLGASYAAEPLPGANRARNRGAGVAQGSHILFLDDDTELVGDSFLANLKEFIDTHSAEVAWGGYYLSSAPANFSTRAYNGAANLWLLKSRKTPRRRPLMVGGCTLIERQVFLDVGGFDIGYVGAAEELLLSQRVQARGHRVLLNRKLSVYHHFEGGWVRALANAYRHGQVKPSTQDPRLDSVSLRRKFALVKRSLVLDRGLSGSRDVQLLIPGLATYYFVVLVGAVVGRWKMRSKTVTASIVDGVSSNSGH